MSVQTEITQALQQALKPAWLEVINESHLHNVPPGSESHFKLVVVAAEFAGKNLVRRHQLIYQILASWLQNPIHALALHTHLPEEWQAKAGQVIDSPQCRGGENKTRV